MSGENEDATPYDGTIDDPTQTQPQVDPDAAPDGTTVADDQQGTTGDAGRSKEPLYQTRYQQLVERLRAQGIDPDTVLESDIQAGSIFAAFQGQQTQGQQPTGGQLDEVDPDEELIDPAYKKYFDRNFSRLFNNVGDVMRKVVSEVEQQKEFQAEAKRHLGDFDKWAADNHVPQNVINKAVQQYQAEFGMAGTPAAIVRVVKQNIKDMGYVTSQTQTQNAAIKTAIEKAKALDGVAQPAPGTAPSPKTEKGKTWQQAEADTIAPERPYVYPD